MKARANSRWRVFWAVMRGVRTQDREGLEPVVAAQARMPRSSEGLRVLVRCFLRSS